MTRFFSLLVLLPLFLAATASAESGKAELPKVLCVVDSFQRGQIVLPATKELKEKAELVFPKVEAYDTGSALERIDEILGEGDWDVIYFSFGLGDLFYKDPATREIRAMSKFAGGVRVSSPEEYEDQLVQLTEKLKASGAKLIWGHTVPLIHGKTSKGEYRTFQENLFDADSPAEYNGIASRVMKRHSVSVVDFHQYVMDQFTEEERLPSFNQYAKVLTGKKAPLHAPFVETVLATIKR